LLLIACAVLILAARAALTMAKTATRKSKMAKNQTDVTYCGYIIHKSSRNYRVFGDTKEMTWTKRDYA
jgi:hypothetical protein